MLNVDKIVHEPARLAILALLSMVESADFKFLQSSLGLTQGNLSAHLSKLEASGMIDVEKSFIGKKVSTVIKLTKEGEQALKKHLLIMKDFLKLMEI
ncbi:MAG: helix-turn-helix domain-containing protein [Gammaproteobacteria bacterium]|nr:helix-turn-helix domain-containing protein [Gammaproteobacteria bacterium]